MALISLAYCFTFFLVITSSSYNAWNGWLRLQRSQNVIPGGRQTALVCPQRDLERDGSHLLGASDITNGEQVLGPQHGGPLLTEGAGCCEAHHGGLNARLDKV
ncbi:hypothetical protein D3C85_1675420 [compost metagenome]